MANFNRTILVGRLTRNIELRATPSGAHVCDITLAINNSVKQGSTWVEEPAFIDVTIWNRMAEVANEHLSKGSEVLIEGWLKQDSWTDQDTGSRRTRLKVVCTRMQMLGTRRQATPEPSDHYENPNENSDEHEEVPF